MRHAPVIWALAGVVAVAAVSSALPRYQRAKAAQTKELASLEQVRTFVRQTAGRSTASDSPSPSLAEAAADGLAEAGLPAAALVAVSPGQEAHIPGPVPIIRRQGSATLEGPTLAELGRFLDHWRRGKNSWTITSIDVAPLGNGESRPETDLPLRITLGAEVRELGPPEAMP